MASRSDSNSDPASRDRGLAAMLGSPGEGLEGSFFLQPVGLISTLTGNDQAGMIVLGHTAQVTYSAFRLLRKQSHS